MRGREGGREGEGWMQYVKYTKREELKIKEAKKHKEMEKVLTIDYFC